MKKVFVVLLVLFFALPFKVNALSVSAKAAVVINGDNGEIIFAQNADKLLPMASTTKIMTALLLCEYGNLQNKITVTGEMLKVEGSSMGLLAGDKVTLHDLLYGLMLASGNDAANVTAFAVAGSIDGFVKLMNDKAKEIGLVNTNFETPSGLDGENHYTTAYELACLTKYAMQNEEFCKAVSCEKATLNYGNPPYKRTLTNHNKLLKQYEGAVGVKTGFTKKSGRCLVSAAKRDGKYVIAVTLNAPNDWQDHKNMLDYGFLSIKQTHFSPRVGSYNIPVIGGETDSITATIEPITVNSIEISDIECTVYLPQFVYAPITHGDVIGKAVYSQGSKVLEEKPILAQNKIDNVKYKEHALSVVLKNLIHIFENI